MAKIDRIVAGNLKAIRERMGLTQEEFAEFLGTNQGRVSRLESAVSLKRLRELGDLLEQAGLDPMDLLSLEEPVADEIDAEIRSRLPRVDKETRLIVLSILRRLEIPDRRVVGAE